MTLATRELFVLAISLSIAWMLVRHRDPVPSRAARPSAVCFAIALVAYRGADWGVEHGYTDAWVGALRANTEITASVALWCMVACSVHPWPARLFSALDTLADDECEAVEAQRGR